MRLIKRALAAGAVALTTAAFSGATPVSALADPSTTPSVTGCPEGWQTLTLDWLASQSEFYMLPFLIDDPANQDQPGNGDGVVCGKAWDETRAERVCGGPCKVPVLYTFRDNDIPALYR